MTKTRSSPERVIIFIHIPKTAGRTVNTILERHYSPEISYSTSASGQYPDGSLNGFYNLPAKQKAKLQLLYGHMGFGLHEQLPQPATYVTILRDPIERVISNYYHIQRDARSEVHRAVQTGKMDLVAFVKYMAADGRLQDNLQTRMIAGDWQQRGYEICTDQMLATAKQNLSTYFTVVGLTEKFDETCLLMQKNFGWPNVYYTKRNVTQNRPSRENVSAHALQSIAEYNQYDLELYEFAARLFEGKIRQQGRTFTREVKKFKLINNQFRPIRLLYWQIRKVSMRVYLQKWQQRIHKQ